MPKPVGTGYSNPVQAYRSQLSGVRGGANAGAPAAQSPAERFSTPVAAKGAAPGTVRPPQTGTPAPIIDYVHPQQPEGNGGRQPGWELDPRPPTPHVPPVDWTQFGFTAAPTVLPPGYTFNEAGQLQFDPDGPPSGKQDVKNARPQTIVPVKDAYGRVALKSPNDMYIWTFKGGKWVMGYAEAVLKDPTKYGMNFEPVKDIAQLQQEHRDKLDTLVKSDDDYLEGSSGIERQTQEALWDPETGPEALLASLTYRDPVTGLTEFEAYQRQRQLQASREQAQALASLAGRGFGRSGSTRIARQNVAEGALADILAQSASRGDMAIRRYQTQRDRLQENKVMDLQALYDAVWKDVQDDVPAGGGPDGAFIPAIPNFPAGFDPLKVPAVVTTPPPTTGGWGAAGPSGSGNIKPPGGQQGTRARAYTSRNRRF